MDGSVVICTVWLALVRRVRTPRPTGTVMTVKVRSRSGHGGQQEVGTPGRRPARRCGGGVAPSERPRRAPEREPTAKTERRCRRRRTQVEDTIAAMVTWKLVSMEFDSDHG